MYIAINKPNNGLKRHEWSLWSSDAQSVHPSFRGSPDTFFNKTTQKGIQTFTNANKIISSVNEIVGDNFFSEAIKKANIQTTDDKIVLAKSKTSDKILATLKYPIADLPRDLLIFILKPLTKDSQPFRKLASNILNSDVLKKRMHDKEVQKSLNSVRAILEEYTSSEANAKYSFTTSNEKLKKSVASNIVKIAKNYDSRDERTLNRIATSTVSAIYSSGDFYNISMLQKDDSNEAKKAQKDRFKQELTRMFLSAGLTFLTLGIIGDKVKKSVVLNSLVIALSALTSEIISRVVNKVPLHPLTSEQAAKIAQRNAQKQQNDDNGNNETTNQTKHYSKVKNAIYGIFADDSGILVSLDTLFKGIHKSKKETKNEDDNNKKTLPVKNIALAAVLFSSLTYLLSKKGMLTKAFDNLSNANSKVKELITTKKYTITLDELSSKINNLSSSKEGQELKNILSEYSSYIEHFKNSKNISEITTRKDRLFLPGVYNGLTKLFSTVYQILSAPGRLINIGIDALKKDKIQNIASDKLNKTDKQMEKELIALDEILTKEKTKEAQAQLIKQKTRNMEKSTETGELASLSRTLVTIIGTYFFVNDYTNKVLIESGGKNLEEAKEERNERIAHKISNFFFNGMLMNLFNSVFKKPLNNSLWQATLIAAATETTNEFLVRKSICQPIGKMSSRQAIIDYEQAQTEKKGLMGKWSKLFRKITGKKTLSQKAGIETDKKEKNM